jgi:serine/threonine protein kinase
MNRSLHHRNIVQFYGIFISSNEETYMVTEYLSKGSLDHVLKIERNEIEIVDLLIM